MITFGWLVVGCFNTVLKAHQWSWFKNLTTLLVVYQSGKLWNKCCSPPNSDYRGGVGKWLSETV